MHDWTVTSILMDWKSGSMEIHLVDDHLCERKIEATGVKEILISRALEWGYSASVNEILMSGVSGTSCQELKIEVQSGDDIRVIADHFDMPDLK